MTLTNRTDSPPGGYAYREPSIGFEVPAYSELAMRGLTFVAQALQTARANNFKATPLDPSYEACVEAVCAYQCARFANKPKLLAFFCSGNPAVVAQVRDASKPVRRGCASCGGARR